MDLKIKRLNERRRLMEVQPQFRVVWLSLATYMNSDKEVLQTTMAYLSYLPSFSPCCDWHEFNCAHKIWDKPLKKEP